MKKKSAINLNFLSEGRLSGIKLLILFICVSVLNVSANSMGVSIYDAQEGVVTGRVTDAQTGEGLPGATVMVQGTTIGTTSGIDGDYSLAVPDRNAVLEYSFIGYVSRRIIVGDNTVINVTLSEDIALLEEIIVIGYGTQRKATLTGSIGTVTGDNLEKVPAISLSNTFAGRIPGLTALNRSGEPGEDFSQLLVRGRSTLGNSAPLIVIDGVAGRDGLNVIEPRDIESVSVLKDASAAIYGARAANGVILITTKRGRTGKPIITYSINQGFQSHTRIPEMSDAALHADFVNYQLGLFNVPPMFSDEDIQKYRDGSSPLTHPNVDWIDRLIKPFSTTSRHNLSIRGGSDNVRYFLSGNFTDQGGMMNEGLHNYNVVGGRANLDVDVTSNFLVSLDLSLSEMNRTRPHQRSDGEGLTTTMMRRIVGRWANSHAYADEGYLAATERAGYNKDKNNLYQAAITAEYKLPFVEGFKLIGMFSIDKAYLDNRNWEKPYLDYAWDIATQTYQERIVGEVASPELFQRTDSKSDYYGNIRLAYDFENETHRFNAFAAMEQEDKNSQFISVFRRDFNSGAIDQIFAGSEENMRTGGSANRFGRRNYFGRASYGFQGKYLIDFNVRYDGSVAFPKEHRWGLFPGVSVGWVLSNEPFFQELDFVDMLKLRGSWGQMGNDAIAPFQYLASYSVTRGAFFGEAQTLQQGVRQGVEPNPNITWEVSNSTNIGLDASLWEGILGMTFDLFQTKRSNILAPRYASMPQYSGLVLPHENLGKVENRGIELALTHQPRRTVGDGFRYNVHGNFSFARNKVIFIDEAPHTPEWQKAEGFPIGSMLYYSAIGIYRSQEEIDNTPSPPGTRVNDLQFEDYNNDGVINALDRVRLPKSSTPEIVFGGGFSFGYKNFDMSVFLQGQARAWSFFYTPMGTFLNSIKEFAENRPGFDPNKESKYPNIYSDEGEVSAWSSTFWLYNTSFLRLKNVELAYNIPQNVMDRFGIINVRLFANGTNLLLLYDNTPHMDPEGAHSRAHFYPQNRIINIGLDITF